MFKNLNITQCNLQKSRTATYEIMGQIINNNLQIGIVQEPYAYKSENTFKIPGHSRLCKYSQNSKKILSCIITNENQDFNTLFVPQLSTEHITVVAIEKSGEQIIIVSVYFPPNIVIQEELEQLQKIIDFSNGTKFLTAGDFNVQCTIRYDRRDDRKAPFLEEFLITINLYLLNTQSEFPT